MTKRAFTRRGLIIASGGALLASCARDAEGNPTPVTLVKPKTPTFVIATSSGLEATNPQDVITVDVTDGELVKVTATDSTGADLPGTLEGNTFTPNTPFHVRETYIIEATANDSAGQPHSQQATASTVNPELVCEIDFRFAGEAVGNGMPLWVRFDMPVNEDQRAAIEASATVTTDPPQPGSFGWTDDSTLQWRPKEYWQPGSTAHIEVKAAGLPAGDTWVLADAEADYTYGDLRVLKTDIDGHRLQCFRNGKLELDIPVSTGMPDPQFETMTGTKLIMTQEETCVMDSETFGLARDSALGYKVTVSWAQRITWSGEYFHAAPWANYAHGNSNVSHGCTGMTTENAKTLFDWASIGDPAEFTGSTHKVRPDQVSGYACWVYSWDEWQGLSALA